MNPRHVASTRLVIAALALLAAACQRQPAPAETPAAAPPPAAPGVPTPPIAPDDVPPEGALRAYGWECSDGSTPLMHNLLRVRAIELDLPGGRQRLEQTVSASGVRYANADGSLVFWTKGTTARIERAGAAPVQCTERRAVSLCEDARLRGVVYRALGNEPGWTLEIGPGTTVDWVTNYGQERHRFDGAVEEAGGDATARTYTATPGRPCA